MTVEKIQDTDKTQPSKIKLLEKISPTNDLGIADTLSVIVNHANLALLTNASAVSKMVRKRLEKIGDVPANKFRTFYVETNIITKEVEQWYYFYARGETKQKCVFVVRKFKNNLLIARRDENDKSSFAYLIERSNNIEDTKEAVVEFIRRDSNKLLTASVPKNFVDLENSNIFQIRTTPETAIFQILALRGIARIEPIGIRFPEK